jgi:hypothetical protein
MSSTVMQLMLIYPDIQRGCGTHVGPAAPTGKLVLPAAVRERDTGTDEGLRMLGWWEIAVLGLASARGTQLIVHDSIGDPLRERLELWHAARFDSGPRTFLRTLLGCVYCVGMHLSWIALLVYLLATGGWRDAPWIVHGIEWFAVAAVQAGANRWDDHLGTGGN